MHAELTVGALKKLKMKMNFWHSPKKAPLKICKFIRSRTSEVGSSLPPSQGPQGPHGSKLCPLPPLPPEMSPRKPRCCHLLQPPCCLLPAVLAHAASPHAAHTFPTTRVFSEGLSRRRGRGAEGISLGKPAGTQHARVLRLHRKTWQAKRVGKQNHRRA